VMPNTTYVASYYAPNGHYSQTSNYTYRSPSPGPNGGGVLDSPPLHIVRNSGGTTNGVYSYGAAGSFPSNSYSAGNYWVDVMFSPTAAPGTVTNVTATAGGKTSANLSWTAPSSGGSVTSYKITPYVGSTAQASTTINGTPPATATTITGLTTGTTYTFTVQAINPTGAGPASAQSNAVTPQTAVAPSVPLNVTATPATSSAEVDWSAPQADGDSPITGYTVTPYIGASAQSPVAVPATATIKTITGLTNGTSYTFKVTATNAAGTSPASAATDAVTPQSTIFDLVTPGTVDAGDSHSVELGMKFRADYSGTITGIRFYKAAANTGTHIGSLWSNTGTLLRSATFTSESGSGWQSVTFSSPVAVTAGTTYVASYFAPGGHYSATTGGLSSAVDNGPLHTLADSASSNGVYAYSATSTYPASTYGASNYWVDVMYAIPAPGQVTGVSASAGGQTSANVNWNAPAGGGPVTSYKVTPYVGTTAQTPTTVAGTATSKTVTGLTTGTTYTFTVQAVNANGAGPASAASNAVTPQGAVAPSAPTSVIAQPATRSVLVNWTTPGSDGDSPITGYTLTPYIGATAQTPIAVSASATSKTVTGLTNGTSYTFKVTATNAAGTSPASAASSVATPEATIFDFTTPSTPDGGEGNSIEVGVRFSADTDGSITGIRYYKAAANTGTHIGNLWSSTGTLLRSATFSGESDSGWQSVTFSSPVAVTAGTSYVASYFAPNGHYSATSVGFQSAIDNPPLHGLADTPTNGNGLYVYNGTSAFPRSNYGASNYWVDVLFAGAPAPGQVTGVTAAAAQASANVSWTAPSSGGAPTSYEVTPYAGATAQPSTTVTGSPPAVTKKITGLTPGTAYTFTVQASNASGPGPVSASSNSVTPTGADVPSAPTSVTAQGDSKSAVVSWSEPSSDGGSPITSYTVTPLIGSTGQTPVTVGASSTTTRITGLTNGTSYTFTVKATSGAGTGPASAASSAVTPQNSIFDLGTPAQVDAGEGNSLSLGVKFRSDVDGSVTGIRFYKAAANTGTHIGSLWASDGTLLRQATFSGETGSGWQSVTFASPVAVTAGTTYVAGYLAPNGHYSVTGGAFGSAIDNAPLHALTDSASSNGVYAYSSTPVFPTNSFGATNYWVDLLFATGL
jgi:fibronectin type 3 domain-containing protein